MNEYLNSSGLFFWCGLLWWIQCGIHCAMLISDAQSKRCHFRTETGLRLSGNRMSIAFNYFGAIVHFIVVAGAIHARAKSLSMKNHWQIIYTNLHKIIKKPKENHIHPWHGNWAKKKRREIKRRKLSEKKVLNDETHTHTHKETVDFCWRPSFSI